MPIIELCKPTDPGARGIHYQAGYLNWALKERPTGDYGPEWHCQGPTAHWVRDTHIGLCIRDYERNGYDDSDFFMVVWDPEKQEPKDICFASTRGWSYPCYGSSPDATPEVMEAYRAWERRQEAERKARIRRDKARKLAELRKSMKGAAATFGFPYQRILRARRELNAARFDAIMWLLTAKVRSGFKLSMRQQVLAWLADPSPKYPTPLSAKQFDYLPRQAA